MISLRSGVTKKILNYLFLNPHESLYVNELSRRLGLDKRNLVKKIKELETEGILAQEKKGNLKIYSINTKYPLYNEYRKIVTSTVGLPERIKAVLKDVDGVKKCYIYGSYAHDAMDAHSDIDLLVVGSHRIVALQKRIAALQKDIGREINVISMSESDFKKRTASKDPFVLGILDKKHIKVV